MRIFKLQRYWEVHYDIDYEHTERWFSQRLRELLEDSVKMHLRADVEVGAYVSGGIDSSMIRELAADRLAQEVALGDLLHRGVDVDIGVVVQRLAVRQREAAGAQHQYAALAQGEFFQQQRAQALDVARVTRRLAGVDYRRHRVVDPEHARGVEAGEGDRGDAVGGVGGLELLRQDEVEADGGGAEEAAPPWRWRAG